MDYSLIVQYRMRCEKSNIRNICTDSKRKMGFYWETATSKELHQIFKNLQLDKHEIDSNQYIHECLEKIPVPTDCEAIRIEFTLYYDQTKANGFYRKNTTAHLFKTLMEDC